MAQVLRKEYTCFNCKKNILISKVDDPNSKKRWEQWELDSVTPHKCKRQQQPQQQQQRYFIEEKQLANLDENRLVNIEKTLAALKTDIRSLITQMQLLRQEVDKLKK
jgi:hypothetical protein